jgi:hypothetical protein
MEPTTIDELRAYGTTRVALETTDGTFVGRLVADAIGDRAVVVLFRADGSDPDVPLVVAVDAIRAISAVH